MPLEPLPRKLAVIMHADVAGSTAPVHRDEALAHDRIGAVFVELSECIEDHGGIAHEFRGHALLAEFDRAADDEREAAERLSQEYLDRAIACDPTNPDARS